MLSKIKKSVNWDKSRNKEKGTLLEELSKIIFNRFVCIRSCETNERTTDNEIDVNIKFTDGFSPEFINRRNLYFICECKNKASSPIDVGMVTKLLELCKHNQAGLGIFMSHNGISGTGWRYGEGKRRKLFLETGIPIVSFTIEELEKYQSKNANYYTDLKRKYNYLIDEIDDDTPALTRKLERQNNFSKFLVETISELKKKMLITDKEYDNIIERIKEKYGLEVVLTKER